MMILNCTTEEEFTVETKATYQDWLKRRGYSPCDHTTVSILASDLTCLAFKIEAFKNERRERWAVHFPEIELAKNGLLLVEIPNATLAALLIELGVSKIKAMAYQIMVEQKQSRS